MTPAHLTAAENLYTELAEAGIAVYLKQDGTGATARDPGAALTADMAKGLKACGEAMREYLRWSLLETAAAQTPADYQTSLRYATAGGRYFPDASEVQSHAAKVVA